MIDIFIPGHAAPQGSKRHVGHGIMVESCKRVKPWRESIRSALVDDKNQPIERIEGAVLTTLEFVMPRPKSAPKRKTPPATSRPDMDKLERAVNDAAVSAGVVKDDSYIVMTLKGKRLAEIGEAPGLYLIVAEFDYAEWSGYFQARLTKVAA